MQPCDCTLAECLTTGKVTTPSDRTASRLCSRSSRAIPPSTPHPQPRTLNPAPSTLHPESHTLKPAPWTLNPDMRLGVPLRATAPPGSSARAAPAR